VIIYAYYKWWRRADYRNSQSNFRDCGDDLSQNPQLSGGHLSYRGGNDSHCCLPDLTQKHRSYLARCLSF